MCDVSRGGSLVHCFGINHLYKIKPKQRETPSIDGASSPSPLTHLCFRQDDINTETPLMQTTAVFPVRVGSWRVECHMNQLLEMHRELRTVTLSSIHISSWSGSSSTLLYVCTWLNTMAEVSVVVLISLWSVPMSSPSFKTVVRGEAL